MINEDENKEKEKKNESENKPYTKLKKLFKDYWKAILIWFILAVGFIALSLLFYWDGPLKENTFEKAISDLAMTIGQAMIGAGLLGGGIGGIINFVFDDAKQREQKIRIGLQKRKERDESHLMFRSRMQDLLQETHDKVELARVLIKSHQSGKTYGEQIRNNIIPSLISLKDFKRKLHLVEESALKKHVECLQVSVTYMVAYLSVLKEEFEANYLTISNLQNYKEAAVSELRKSFIDSAKDPETVFDDLEVPDNITVVWDALQKLDYLKDFIGDIRNEEGKRSLYFNYFLLHYYHCIKIIKSRESEVNQKMVNKKTFMENINELSRIEEKKNSDTPLTKNDSLTRKIMVNELNFDFETSSMKKK